MKKTLIILIILILIVFAPNLVWLVKSTAFISNRSSKALNFLTVHINRNNIQLGRLMPGQSRFIMLPKTGDTTFEISYVKGGNLVHNCRQYVEDSMYSVEARIYDTRTPECNVKFPFLSESFLVKMINELS